jgi:hypothetical protein
MRFRWPQDTEFHRLVLDVEQDSCGHCGSALHICDHRIRHIDTLDQPLELCCRLAPCADAACPSRPHTLSPAAELTIALPGWLIGWDVFCWIGHRRFARHWSVPQLRAELLDSFRIQLSPDAISDYCQRYQIMLAAHQQDFDHLHRVYQDIATVDLTIAGLQPEKGHETLYVVRELRAKRIWFAEALLSSTEAEIRRLLGRRDGPTIGQTHSIDMGLAEVKEQQAEVKEQVQEIQRVAETLDGASGTVEQRQEKYEQLQTEYEKKGGEFYQQLAKVMLAWMVGLFQPVELEPGEKGPVDNLELERWFRNPKGHERRIHGHKHAGVRIVQEGPTLVLALDAHLQHAGPFTAEDLCPYRHALPPPDQLQAIQRRKVMRKARSKKTTHLAEKLGRPLSGYLILAAFRSVVSKTVMV